MLLRRSGFTTISQGPDFNKTTMDRGQEFHFFVHLCGNLAGPPPCVDLPKIPLSCCFTNVNNIPWEAGIESNTTNWTYANGEDVTDGVIRHLYGPDCYIHGRVWISHIKMVCNESVGDSAVLSDAWRDECDVNYVLQTGLACVKDSVRVRVSDGGRGDGARDGIGSVNSTPEKKTSESESESESAVMLE